MADDEAKFKARRERAERLKQQLAEKKRAASTETTASAPKLQSFSLKRDKTSTATGPLRRPLNAAFGTNKTAAVSGRDPNAVVARHATVDDAEDDIDDDALRTATKRAKLTLFSHQNDVGVTQMTASSTPAEPAAAVKATSKSTTAHDDVNDGLDALDAFMANVEKDVEKIRENDAKLLAELAAAEEHGARAAEAALEDGQVGNNNNNDMSDDEDEDGNVGAASDLLAGAARHQRTRRKDLQQVDHTTIAYEPFRKNFYNEPPELAAMSRDEVEIYRKELDGIKIRGQRCPKPVKKWSHCGLPLHCEQVIKMMQFKAPTPIQAQTIPAIMSGRDVIGVAKTGSGKTMAFLLPMLRHVKDQRPLEPGEGSIAVILTPTRELALQIFHECKRFTKGMGLRVVCAYGGAQIKDQIADMKRGAEIAVCTPGRFIDLLCANSGKVTNLRRTTFLVLDEADRMFDLGFEAQVMRVIGNVRPDCQRVLFSATFPKHMEGLARRVLHKPLEITVGGRSVVSPEISQLVEIHNDEDTKFLRLLEILGYWYDEEKDQRMLIFVDRQEAADELLRELFRRGYPSLSLHGGKDQVDRDSTIADFKSGVLQIMVATSVAARGLDVKELNVVINYQCPNHMEDYVHRVGRTGRAGRKGTAYTFISQDEERYTPDIVQALKSSGAPIPEALQTMADEFMAKVKRGDAKLAGSGFGGRGLERIEKEREQAKIAQKKVDNKEAEIADEEEEEEADEAADEDELRDDGGMAVSTAPSAPMEVDGGDQRSAVEAASVSIAGTGVADASKPQQPGLPLKRDLASIAAQINASLGSRSVTSTTGGTGVDLTAGPKTFHVDVELNDLPQKARLKATHKHTIHDIEEITGATLTVRGVFVPPGRSLKPGERKLFMFIEAEEKSMADRARAELLRAIREVTAEIDPRSMGSSGRYSVV